MDQVAGPAVASLDQPAGSVLEEPDGPTIDHAIFDLAIISPAVAGEFDPASLSVPTAPPPPAWLVRRPVKKTSRKSAIVALTAMLVAAVALGFTAVNLALKGFAASSARSSAASAGLLAWPPPPTAGGLPLHSPVVNNQGTKRAMAQFRRRFGALLGGSTATYPAALYNEPGRVDLVTGSPAWVMYLGFNEHPKLTDPVATVNRLMASLAGPSATVRPWAVATGPAGGIAKCSVAIIGLTQVAVCGWATEGTIGALMSPTRDTTVTELAVLMSKMRPDL